ncbi:hypothetical protein ANN_11002 [Periplaneta americana]|uniref:HTH CENPB-type domain-containing protein n=1 Tax=Periplaneta americana TaxID=6978 RepID=A0ABQ8T577_PERAM|nr:hypothetical protein ANN_11002 [Periplaneta americana]
MVKLENKSIQCFAKHYDINYRTLARYCNKFSDEDITSNVTRPSVHVGYYPNRLILPVAVEKELAEYIKVASDKYFSLSPKEVRKLRYELAMSNGLKVPAKWTETEQAGADWFSGFMKRHKDLSIRTSEATSLARASGFNKKNVGAFFDNLTTVMRRHNFEPKDEWNVDETGITTVQKLNRIVSRKGFEQRQLFR